MSPLAPGEITGPWRGTPRLRNDHASRQRHGAFQRRRSARAAARMAIDYINGYLMAFGAMIALARRAEIGGSWLVNVSLVRTGRWIVEQGLIDAALLANIP